ncbi:MAG: sensor domain-containing diguanylate cyclase [Acidimicrobiales bacterium]
MAVEDGRGRELVSFDEISPDAHPFRSQGRLLRTLPFAVVAILAASSLALPRGLYSWRWATASLILLGLVFVAAVLPWDHGGAVSLMNPSKNLLETPVSWGGEPQPGASSKFGPQDCWALRRGRLHESGESGPYCRHLGASPPEGSVCFPMRAQGETIGVLQLRGAARGEPDDVTRQLLVTVGEQLALAMANFQLRLSLRNQSIRDPLTNLFNRRYMEETLTREISRAQRNCEPVGVLQIDVDHFKPFNDSHGHEAGDSVLKALGGLFLSVFRGADVACRYGGEEFTVILPGSSLEATEARAIELSRLVAVTPIPFRSIQLDPPTLSVGVAVFPAHDTTVPGLLRVADAALYAAKANGRDQIVCAPVPTAPPVESMP